MFLTSSQWWTGAIERALKTAAQTAIAAIGVDQVAITALDWQQIAAISATATVLSLLTSIAAPYPAKHGASGNPTDLDPYHGLPTIAYDEEMEAEHLPDIELDTERA